MTAYYNEIDPYCAVWLQNLINAGEIATGYVDTRSIKDVEAVSLAGFRRAHFFAGVAGWDLALQLADWPEEREVWTGSCPCQPYSAAGKRKGDADERNLWPDFFRLIRERRPECVFGEQVAGAIGHGWLDRVSADLEAEGYAVGAAVLGASGVGAPHRRQRLYWVASRELGHANGTRRDARRAERQERSEAGSEVPAAGGEVGTMGDAASEHKQRIRQPGKIDGRTDAAGGSSSGGLGELGHANSRKLAVDQEQPARQELATTTGASWADCIVIPCRDGKRRRISAQSGDEPLASRVPVRKLDPRMGYLLTRLAAMGHDAKAASRLLRAARSNRVGRLRAYGNAIVPQVAAEFVRAFLEVQSDG